MGSNNQFNTKETSDSKSKKTVLKSNYLDVINSYKTTVIDNLNGVNARIDYNIVFNKLKSLILEFKIENENNEKEIISLDNKYSNLLKIDKDTDMFFYNLGALFKYLGDINNSIKSFNLALKINPYNYESINHLGDISITNKDYNRAIKIYKKGISLNKNYLNFYLNLSTVYYRKNDFNNSLTVLKNASLLPIENNEVNNLLYIYEKIIDLNYKLGNIDEAIKVSKALIKYNNDPKVIHGLSYLELSNKNFKEGWKLYESRYLDESVNKQYLKYGEIRKLPLFTGKEDLEGKDIFLHTEQGFGDSIMFSNFINNFKDKFKNCNITVQCEPELIILFNNSFPDITFYSTYEDKLPKIDFQCSLMSLGKVLNINSIDDINNNSFLNPKSNKENENKLKIDKQKNKTYVGIAWGADHRFSGFEEKAFNLEYFQQFIDDENIILYSLQKGPFQNQLKLVDNNYIIDLSEYFNDFNDTAYLVNQLDYVVTSDTSVSHLAGALGKETYIALKKIPDWRWTINDDKSYWYSNTKLIRQEKYGEWSYVLNEIYNKLKKETI